MTPDPRDTDPLTVVDPEPLPDTVSPRLRWIVVLVGVALVAAVAKVAGRSG